MTLIETDLCVIGAGSGGLSVAAGAVQMGARVVLVEGGAMGGDCLNAGCVPSKALLAAGRRAAAHRHGGLGITADEPVIDYGAAKDHVAAVIAGIAPHDSAERFQALGCTVLRDWARFTSPTEVQVGPATVRARRFVVATGSRPAIPPIPGLDETPYLTNETIFALRDRPGHLIVLGAGPIGLEMAQAHRRLGCRVTVIEAAHALGREDPDAAALVTATLKAEGVDIREGLAVTAVRGRQGAVHVALADGTALEGSHLLVAVGRKVALDRLDLAAAGVDHTSRGITVGANLRSTSNPRVFAVGDAAGGAQFTHLAGYHAGIVIRQAVLGLPARARNDHIPRVTYTEPELAQIGPTEAEARAQHGKALTVIREAFAGNDRARTEDLSEGFVKLMVLRGRPIGATLVGPGAGELLAPLSLAIASRMKMSQLAGVVLPYPTRSEIIKRAAGAYFSPRLFANPWLKRLVRLVQRYLP